MNKIQKINCNVSTCKYNNFNTDECSLKEIKVTCDCNKDIVKEKSETICSSFKEAKLKE